MRNWSWKMGWIPTKPAKQGSHHRPRLSGWSTDAADHPKTLWPTILWWSGKGLLSLKDNKAAGPDNIPPEVIKYGGCALHRKLHNFILDCWSAKCLPHQLKNANIILVHKQKGDRAEFGNSRGISLLSVAVKVMAKIMLTRLLVHVVDLVLPESQCGFRRGRSTIDMIFVARQLQEKCRE